MVQNLILRNDKNERVDIAILDFEDVKFIVVYVIGGAEVLKVFYDDGTCKTIDSIFSIRSTDYPDKVYYLPLNKLDEFSSAKTIYENIKRFG